MKTLGVHIDHQASTKDDLLNNAHGAARGKVKISFLVKWKCNKCGATRQYLNHLQLTWGGQ